MALTAARVNQLASVALDIANESRDLNLRVAVLLAAIQVSGVDFSTVDGTKVTVDSNGNLTGFNFPPSAMVALLGTFGAVNTLLNNGVPAQGNHLANVLSVATPS